MSAIFFKEGGVGIFEPDDHRFARDVTVARGKSNGADNGDIVVVRITRHPIEHHHAVGEVIEVVGKDLTPGMETEIAIRKHEIPHVWSEEAIMEMAALGDSLKSVEHGPGRVDLRSLPLVTIDGQDARDFDDAVYCESTGQGWRLIVAIADVSHYVRADSALDREAFSRGVSVYFPNRVIPMLPEALSNGICSLNPGEDRFCMVCDLNVSSCGEITDYRFLSGHDAIPGQIDLRRCQRHGLGPGPGQAGAMERNYAPPGSALPVISGFALPSGVD